MEKNPSYSVTDVQDSSVDHHYDFIPGNDDTKDKKKQTIVIVGYSNLSVLLECICKCDNQQLD